MIDADTKTKALRYCLVILATCLVFGCASVPLSTLWKLKSFDHNAFVELDPDTIRMKVTVFSKLKLNNDDTELGLELTNEQGSMQRSFSMHILSEVVVPATQTWLTQTPGYTQYTFRLSDDSINNFRDVQDFIATELHTTIGLDAHVGFVPSTLSENTAVFSIELLFSPQDGYFVLVEEAEVQITKTAIDSE